MFGIGLSEMIMIAVVALVVIGPRKLPATLRTIGRAIAQFRRVITQIKDEVGYDSVVDEVVRPLREGMFDLNAEIARDDNLDDASLGITAEYPEGGADDYEAMPEREANAYPEPKALGQGPMGALSRESGE
ncbi:MAG: Sec-independent protein translocase protein TatB [Deltaproteobacteria bacterium]|nr:Sec-independent protein translocase protein TatB [Deltaproteobacteria bacterium]